MDGTRVGRDGRARLEAGALAALIVLGCQALWLVVPVGTLWVLSRLFGSVGEIAMAGLVAMPMTIGGAAWLLAAANRRWLRLAGGARRGRGPLEATLPPSIVVALLTASIWFVFFANHLPSGREQLLP